MIHRGLGVLLPCTDTPTPADLLTARNILGVSTSPGYALQELSPRVTSGRNPHRWIATFTRNDNNYSLTAVKKDFKRYCPMGSEIQIVNQDTEPNRNRIVV